MTSIPHQVQSVNTDEFNNRDGNHGTQPLTVQATAHTCLALGLSVVPIRGDGSKAPQGEWKAFQTTRLDEARVTQTFFPGCGIALIGGAVSGELEILDFDQWLIWLAFEQLAHASGCGALLDRMRGGYFERSPNGVHLPYRCEGIEGNQKLAKTYERDEDGTILTNEKGKPLEKTLIETKAEGGYCIIAPTNGKVHASGKPYTLVSGSLATIPTITPAERKDLLDLARTFNEIVAPPTENHYESAEPHGDRPGDRYNARATWEEVLAPHGWVRVWEWLGTTHWRRPGKDRGSSATTNFKGSDILYVFSTSTVFEAERGYRKFSAFALLNHNSDFSAAAAALVQEHGWATDTPPPPEYDGSEESAFAGGQAETVTEPPELEEEEDSEEGEFATDAREAPEEPYEPTPSLYPCPESLWCGVFADVADRIGKRSWEVWMGVYSALSAVAARNLHWFYFSDHLFGMSYSLLLSETGAGKGIVINTTRSLLPENYSVAYGIQSGPALIPILTDDDLNNKTGRLTVQGRPTMLVCEEWSRLLQVAGIQNATLIEDLNALHHRAYPWGQGRSHKTKSGGSIEIKDPTLTICGTSTIKLFTAGLSERFIFSGGLNRYLILPGESQYEEYTGQVYSTGDLQGLLDGLITHTAGHGTSLRDAYSATAWERWLDLQRHFFLPLANDPERSEVMKRLHVHFHHVCLLYAWSERSKKIEMHHLRAAVQVISTSHKFLLALLDVQHSHVEPGPTQRYEMGIEQRITDKVRKEPGIAKRKVQRDLARQGSYTAIGKAVEGMVRDGLLLGKWDRNQCFLRLPKGEV